MAQNNPFIHAYGARQGRIQPTGWTPTDGEYVYVLGDEDLASYDFRFTDYVEVSQDLDLTGVNMLRVDSRIVQPTMVVTRNVAINAALASTATLKRGEILESLNLRTNSLAVQVNPGSETQLKEPFNILAGSYLRVEVDGGGDVDIQFPASPPVLALTAAEVVARINTGLGATAALAQVGHDTTDPSVIITADSTGMLATFEVKDYPGLDANDQLGFFQKTARPISTDTAIYGGDDLSAILAPDANFAAVDIGLPLKIIGATTDPDNNSTNRIAAVLNATTATLCTQITNEPVGFDANILASLWAISLHVSGTEVFSKQVSSNKTVDTDDIAANVSKLTGTHEVLFRLQLLAA